MFKKLLLFVPILILSFLLYDDVSYANSINLFEGKSLQYLDKDGNLIQEVTSLTDGDYSTSFDVKAGNILALKFDETINVSYLFYLSTHEYSGTIKFAMYRDFDNREGTYVNNLANGERINKGAANGINGVEVRVTEDITFEELGFLSIDSESDGSLIDNYDISVSSYYPVDKNEVELISSGSFSSVNLPFSITGQDSQSVQKALVTFEKPMDLKNAVAYLDIADSNRVSFKFFDENLNYLGLKFMKSSVPYLADLNYEKVKHVVISQNSTNETTTFNEMYLYGFDNKDIENVSNLNVAATHEKVTLSWDIPKDNPDFTGSKIYRNGSFLTSVDEITNVYADTEVLPNESYTYKVTALYGDGSESSGAVGTVTTQPEPADTDPAGEIKDLTSTTYPDKIDFSWLNPVDDDFDKVNIYQDGVLIGDSANGKFSALNLEPETKYNFVFKTLDMSGNESVGTPLQVVTTSIVDEIPPNQPTNVRITEASNGGLVKWDKNLETDIAGYNVYVDGVKDNTTPIVNNSYSLIGLDADSEYQVSVSAVDKSGNESPQSTAVALSPDSSTMPLLKMGFDLKDVADGVGGHFNAIWLIIAFACAIPLSFYIANRIKLMFLN